MKKILLSAAAAVLLIFWACMQPQEDGVTSLNVEGDASWTGFSKLVVEVRDTSGNVIDTLFIGKLESLDKLKGLPSTKYTGGKAVFVIRGYQDSVMMFEQIRKFNESTGEAVIETTLAIGAPLRTFKATPESLTLYLGGPDSAVKLDIAPAFVHPKVAWDLEGDAVTVTTKDGEYRAGIKAKQAGHAELSISPKGNDSLARKIGITVIQDEPKLEVTPAKTFIVPGKTVEFTVKAYQEYGDLVLFQWDLDANGYWDDSLTGPWKGKDVTLPVQGRAYKELGKFPVRFRVKDSEGNIGSGEALVEVGERKPAVDLQPKDVLISIKDEVKFKGEIREPEGKLTGYGWDYNADGKADDESTLNDTIATVTATRTYNDTGVFKIALSAKDADGKIGTDTVSVTVVKDAPVLDPGQALTAKSTAAVTFQGTATQKFGTILMYKWDFDGNGTWDDSSAAPMNVTHTYGKEADYSARFTARDDDGNEPVVTRKITISDVPFVITTKRGDTTITIKDQINLTASVRNDDGKALTWSWDFNADGKYDDTVATSEKAFNVSVPFRYNSAGKFRAMFRVQDAQGKALYDSVWVTVILDAPKADLGKDDTVLTGESVAIKLLATQQIGTVITKRELQINDTVWVPISKQDTTLVMPLASGTVRIIGRVTDDDLLTGVDTMYVVVKYPDENHLSGIFLTPGTLVPGFSADSLTYAATYAFATTSVTLGGAARDPKATVVVNGTTLTASVTSVAVALPKVGTTSATIVVTAQDTSAKRTYTVNLIRSASTESRLSKITPSAGALSPAFAPSTLSYTLAVPDSVDTLQFTPAALDTMERITVAGTAVASNTLSQKLPIKIGTQKFDIVSTAGSGTKSTYSITVVRKGWSLSGVKGFTPARAGLHCMISGGGSAYIGLIDSANKSTPLVWKGDSASWAGLPSFATDTNTYYVALDMIGGVPWLANLSRNYPGASIPYYIYHRKYTGAWSTTAKTIASSYGGSDLNLSHDKNDVPFTHYRFSYMTQNQYTYKFPDTAWIMAASSPGAYDSLSNVRMLVNRANGTPIIAGSRLMSTGTYQMGVYNVVGVNYALLGNVNWPIVQAKVDLALDSLGTVYVAYIDGVTKKIGVRKYAGAAWTELGPAGGFSEGDASSVNLVLVNGTTPAVAYRDAKRASVAMKVWTGTAWIDFGDPDFTVGDAQQVRMSVDNASVWIAFSAAAAGDKVSVMRRPLP